MITSHKVQICTIERSCPVSCSCPVRGAVVRAFGSELVDPPPPLPPGGFLLSVSTPFLTYIQPPEWGWGGGGYHGCS